MKNNIKIAVAIVFISGGIFAWLKWFKKKPLTAPDGINTVIGNTQIKTVVPTKPVVIAPENSFQQIVAASRPVFIPEIPKTHPDGSPVHKSVLNDPEYIKAWNAFYGNTIFPPGDIRNTTTPSGGMWIGDGNGGFWDPNA